MPYKTVFFCLNITFDISNQFYRKKKHRTRYTCFHLIFLTWNMLILIYIISHQGDFASNSGKVSVFLTIPLKGARETRFPRYFRLAICVYSSVCFAGWQVVGFSQLTFLHKSSSFKFPLTLLCNNNKNNLNTDNMTAIWIYCI